MQNPTKPPRPRCTRCQRPASHCLCAHIPTVANRTRVLILQHPDESKHPLNTAKLAVLGLQQAELWVGEHFPELGNQLTASGTAVLLFPASDDSQLLPAASVKAGKTPLLIVPDGTWRQVRKIIQANPLLGTLPRLGLPAGAPSAYRVRQTREPAAVSTLEAIVRGLSILEPEQDFQPLLAPFTVMVEQQIEAIGPEVYQRNYPSTR
ncbi:MAG: tRNA-uridine aminocarboxypropyltransferase [Pigmentiphaga sp.]